VIPTGALFRPAATRRLGRIACGELVTGARSRCSVRRSSNDFEGLGRRSRVERQGQLACRGAESFPPARNRFCDTLQFFDWAFTTGSGRLLHASVPSRACLLHESGPRGDPPFRSHTMTGDDPYCRSRSLSRPRRSSVRLDSRPDPRSPESGTVRKRRGGLYITVRSTAYLSVVAPTKGLHSMVLIGREDLLRPSFM